MDKRPRESLKMDVPPPSVQTGISRLQPRRRGSSGAVQGRDGVTHHLCLGLKTEQMSSEFKI